MLKVRFNFSKKINPKEKEENIPLVITYHPILNCLSEIIRDNLHLLYMNDEVKKVFSLKSTIYFRSARKLSSHFVRDKIYSIERTLGSFKCTKKCCEVYKSVNITGSFASLVTQNTYKINHKRKCNHKCLIYLFTCKQCSKQYIWETTDPFRKSWNNYKSNARKFLRRKSCMQQHLFEHFQSPKHICFVEDVHKFFWWDRNFYFLQMWRFLDTNIENFGSAWP